MRFAISFASNNSDAIVHAPLCRAARPRRGARQHIVDVPSIIDATAYVTDNNKGANVIVCRCAEPYEQSLKS